MEQCGLIEGEVGFFQTRRGNHDHQIDLCGLACPDRASPDQGESRGELPRRVVKERSQGFNPLPLDFFSPAPDRLMPAYQVPLIDIDFAVQQVEALAAAGARAVHIPTFPAEVGLPEYHDERYDPVWNAVSEAGLS